MSKVTESRRVSVPDIVARKGGTPLVCLTAYTAPMAALLDPHADLLLVGDSVGMVVHGLPTPIGVTLDMMILHGQAVMRGARRAMVVIDLPFGSFEAGPEQAFRAAARVLTETGAQAVKIESSEAMADTVRFLTQRGVPVVGHVGLRPQSVLTDGGFKAKGRSDAERARVMAEALATEAAGAFAVVVEGVAADLGADVTRALRVPTIGIGASSACDGQILVVDDMLGLSAWTPRFVRRYAELSDTISRAVAAYAEDVRALRFPGEAEVYTLRPRG